MMNVLIACEESQAVCMAFRERGHRAFSCDLQECSGGHPEWHIQADCLPLLNGNCSFRTAEKTQHTQTGQWDLIIAHPPCTYLAKASACRLYIKAGYLDPERTKKMVDARLFFQKFLDAKCDKICIENPTPLKVASLPPPSQIIQPYMFGHPYSKRTCLWLKGLPDLLPTKVLQEYTPWMPSNTGGLARGQGGSRGIAHDAKTAAKTFKGVATAMAEQWTGEY